MGSDTSTLFHNKPFPVNSGDLQVVRTHERFTPAYGKSKIPHVQKYPKYPRDAMGRIVIEDGLGRLLTSRPPCYVALLRPLMDAELFFSTIFLYTDKLNAFMKQTKMVALCVISSYEVIMLCDGNFNKACKNKKIANVDQNTASLATRLNADPNRLNEAQLSEVIIRMRYAYRKYGVGALVMHENKFSYRIIVPNKTEYANHKAMYDNSERTIRIAYDINHIGTKRTRSGKKFWRRYKAHALGLEVRPCIINKRYYYCTW